MQTFTLLFVSALVSGTALQLWLLRRQGLSVLAHRHRVPSHFADSIGLAEHQKAADYTLAKLRLAAVEVGVSLILILGWTLGGGVAALQVAWDWPGLAPLASGVGLVTSFFLISGLLGLPIAVWHTFVVESRFGFNRTTPGRFAVDQLLEAGIGLALGIPLVWALLWLMEQAGNLWWLAAWALWMGFTLLLTWAFPVLIAPLFNRFTPLQEGELKQRVQRLLERCGFRSRGIFVMDGSRRSGHGNAYFAGFGRNKRIIFYDTLVTKLAVDELEAVLAHELGHFKLRHVLKRLFAMAVLSAGGLALLGWLAQQTWFYSGLGVSSPSAATALVLFLIAAPVFGVFFEPLGSLVSRRHEYQADAYAVAQSDGQSLIRALLKLYKDNASTLTPDPLYSAFHDSHPPAPLRVAHITATMATRVSQETTP